MWKTANGKPMSQGFTLPVLWFVICLQVVGRYILAASDNGIVFSYSIKSGKLKKKYEGSTGAVTCLCVIDSDVESESKYPEKLVTGSHDDYLRCYMLKVRWPRLLRSDSKRDSSNHIDACIGACSWIVNILKQVCKENWTINNSFILDLWSNPYTPESWSRYCYRPQLGNNICWNQLWGSCQSGHKG